MRSGFATLIGRPNVGKSTLLNSIIGRKIAITSDKPQTTRNIIQGIYHDNDTQLIFIDTPGIHKPTHKLGKHLNDQAYFSLEDVDVILFLVDVTEPFGAGDRFVLDRLKDKHKPIILILNKVDKMNKADILPIIEEYRKIYDFAEIVPLSALKNDNVERLISVIKKYITDNIKYYDDDYITNVSTNFMVAEFVREKVMILTNDEVPHSVTCLVEKIEEQKDITNIYVVIIVDRDNLKKIIIGKKGSMIKEIGVKARQDIEDFLGKKVYLDLYVKTIPKWRDREKYLIELGFRSE